MQDGRPSFAPYDQQQDGKPYIFVSYSHLDQREVVSDLEQLSRLGFRIWYDERILVGRAWSASIEDHIKRCQLFVIFVSKDALDSDNVLAELELAKTVKKTSGLTILPVFLADDISNTNFDYIFLRRLQGVEKYKYRSSSTEYYLDLVGKLESIAPGTREDDLERDSTILGLGYLPTFKDLLCDDKTLTHEEQEERRRTLVLDMRKEARPITAYRIANMFQLTSDTTQALQHLGELKILENDPTRPSNLLTRPLCIDEVYVAPLRLVVGLITRLDQNWPPLVASYSRLVKQDLMNHLEDLHYYIEFCWLAWGPSVPTTSLLDENHDFMVVQAAFGDEANSLPLIMKPALWRSVEDRLGKRDGGWPVCLENALIVRPGTDDFFKTIRSHPLFAEIFSDTSRLALYLPSQDHRHLDGDIKPLAEKTDAYYSTAYVWLMLEQIKQDELRSEAIVRDAMRPGTIIPFFEHANLATTKGLEFLQHCLARKALHHVLDCERDPDYRTGGYYRFATALFPARMVDILAEEIARLGPQDQQILRNRLRISNDPREWRTAVEVVAFADHVEKVIKDSCKMLIEGSEAAAYQVGSSPLKADDGP